MIHRAFDDPVAASGLDLEVVERFREVRDQIGVRLAIWLAEQGFMTGDRDVATEV